uniref:Uncharacterized protein n=1 Tax=Triticum urartu TaxID=4572 RepID=A0A8R7QD96_TRIUA
MSQPCIVLFPISQSELDKDDCRTPRFVLTSPVQAGFLLPRNGDFIRNAASGSIRTTDGARRGGNGMKTPLPCPDTLLTRRP